VKLRNSQAVSFCNCLSRTNYLIAASSQKSLCPAKHGKPLSDGDIIITAVLSVSNSLFHDLPNKDKIIRQISKMPLSRNTVNSLVSGWFQGFSKKTTPICTWLCAGISPVQYALQTLYSTIQCSTKIELQSRCGIMLFSQTT